MVKVKQVHISKNMFPRFFTKGRPPTKVVEGLPEDSELIYIEYKPDKIICYFEHEDFEDEDYLNYTEVLKVVRSEL